MSISLQEALKGFDLENPINKPGDVINVLLDSMKENKRKLFDNILRQILNREPTIDDYKKILLRTGPYVFNEPQESEMYFEGMHIGKIREGFGADEKIKSDRDYRINSKYILEFIPAI